MPTPDRDWDQTYRDPQSPPWDTRRPSTQLRLLLESGSVKPCRALDLGCGTGTNVIFLAQQGFSATGVDLSGVAIQRAREKARAAAVSVNFVCASVLALPDFGVPFAFVFDCGCFHTLAKDQRRTFVEQVLGVTRPGSIFLLLCGNAKEPLDPGPPTVSEEEIRATFSRDFDIEWIREFRLDTVNLPKTPLGYATLMRRRLP
ncbi:MAG: class I SAM-dependent methyltransferase [Verrucomicrobia bacterium]|nr:class I SAM-dependent methyltransferase [Verrucomicrobiota bacterium]